MVYLLVKLVRQIILWISSLFMNFIDEFYFVRISWMYCYHHRNSCFQSPMCWAREVQIFIDKIWSNRKLYFWHPRDGFILRQVVLCADVSQAVEENTSVIPRRYVTLVCWSVLILPYPLLPWHFKLKGCMGPYRTRSPLSIPDISRTLILQLSKGRLHSRKYQTNLALSTRFL